MCFACLEEAESECAVVEPWYFLSAISVSDGKQERIVGAASEADDDFVVSDFDSCACVDEFSEDGLRLCRPYFPVGTVGGYPVECAGHEG